MNQLTQDELKDISSSLTYCHSMIYRDIKKLESKDNLLLLNGILEYKEDLKRVIELEKRISDLIL